MRPKRSMTMRLPVEDMAATATRLLLQGNRRLATDSGSRSTSSSATAPETDPRRAAGMALHEQVEATDVALDEPVVRTSALRLTLASPLYRGATIAVFLSALGFSAAAPQIASFLVNDLGASLTAAGLFYLTNLTAPVAGYLVGRRSDRTGRRLGLFRVCAVLGFAGWLGIAYSTQLWMPYVISAVIGAFGGAATSQLFAAIHDEQKAHPNPNNDGVVAVVRMALTGGWVIGPVAGSFLAAQTSLHTMLLATAICTLAQIVPLGRLRTPRPHPRSIRPPNPTHADPACATCCRCSRSPLSTCSCTPENRSSTRTCRST